MPDKLDSSFKKPISTITFFHEAFLDSHRKIKGRAATH